MTHLLFSITPMWHPLFFWSHYKAIESLFAIRRWSADVTSDTNETFEREHFNDIWGDVYRSFVGK